MIAASLIISCLTCSAYAGSSWYSAAYGVDMRKVVSGAYVRFHILSPRRWVRMVRMMPWRNFVMELGAFLLFFLARRQKDEPLPEDLRPLTELFVPDAMPVTSAETQRKRRVVTLQPVS